MSQSTDKTSCISHRQNIRFFVMYEDFLDVARVSEEHQYKLAAFWRVLETKTNDQIIYNTKLIENARTQGLPEPETTLWIEIPYSEFVNRSLGVYKSSSFQFASAESERLGFSKCRVLKRPRNPRDPNSPLEEYKEYLFLTEAMQTVLTSGVYPTPIENNSPLLKSYNERKAKRAIKNNTTPIENNTGSAIENNSPPIEINNNKYITSITDKNTEVIESSDDVAIANHHASSPTLPESGTIQGHHQGSEQSPEIVHAPSFSTDPDAKGDVSPTQDSGFLPSGESKNASVSSIPSNEPPTQSQATLASPQSQKTALSTNDTSNQASYSRENARETPDNAVPSVKPIISLSPEAQAVYDEWRQLPWFKVAPELTATLAAHCETAKAYGTQNTTLEVMLKVKNWATSKENDKKGYYKGKGWNMKFFLNELPKWLSVQPEQKSGQSSSKSASNDISDIERRQLINFFIDHPDQIEMAAEEYPDLVKIAKAELEKLVLARGA